jgi:predicted  nucleic acid-binding Zn-ribbon protein
VSAEDQQLYQRLRQSKRQHPVARLEEGNCAACGEETSSAHIQEARRGATLIRCTGCERILYVE